MDRIESVLSILKDELNISHKKQIIETLQKEFPQFLVTVPFDQFELTKYKTRKTKFEKVMDIFVGKSDIDIFDVNRLKNLQKILSNTQISKSQFVYFGNFVLNQYILFLIRYENKNTIENIDVLLSLLTCFIINDHSILFNTAIYDLLNIFIENYQNDVYQNIFNIISDYFSNQYCNDTKCFSLLPKLLQKVIEFNGFDNSSEATKLSSLLSLLLVEKSSCFENDTLIELYNIISPFLDQMNSFSLIIMQQLINLLPKFINESYFAGLPSKFVGVVEVEENPHIPRFFNSSEDNKTTSERNLIEISVSSSPECNFRFNSFETFFDIDKKLEKFQHEDQYTIPNYSIICCQEYFIIVDQIVKMLSNSAIQNTQIFIDSFSNFIDIDKANSKFKFDYISILIFFLIKISSNKVIAVPKDLFSINEVYEMVKKSNQNSQGMIEKKNKYYTLFYFLLSEIFLNDEHNFEIVLKTCVKYPCILKKICNLCRKFHVDKILSFLNRQPNLVRTFQLISIQLQSAEFSLYQNKQEDSQFKIHYIEDARFSVLMLLFRIFDQKSYLALFFAENLFLSFFLTLLFEPNLRHLIIAQIKNYLTIDNLSNDQLIIFLIQLTQVIEQIILILPSNDGFLLINDILSIIDSTSLLKCSEVFVDFANSVKKVTDFLDDSELSRNIFYQLIKIFIPLKSNSPHIPNKLSPRETSEVSSSNSSILISQNSSYSNTDFIEEPLKFYSNSITTKEYYLLICLLAGEFLNEEDFLKDHFSKFEIKNGSVMKILFHVFIDNTNIKVIDLSTRLCLHSKNNCIALHKCGFDIVLLDYLLEHRNDEHNAYIPDILTNITCIASVISSPMVVQKFISLFIPIDNRYTTRIHHMLLQPLQMILTTALECPANTLQLNQAKSISISLAKQQIEKNGFTFTCWILYKNGSETNIFSLSNGDNTFFSIKLNQNLIVIENINTGIQLPNKRWEFISVSYFNGLCLLYIGSQDVWKTQLNIKIPSNITKAHIGSDYSNNSKKSNRCGVFLGNFGLFPKHFLKLPKNIFELGPRSTQIKFNPLFYYHQSNIDELSGFSTMKEERSFTDILLRFFKIEILLPFFAQIDLPMPNGEKSDLNVTDIVSVFRAALYAGELNQNDFYKARGFSIISHLLLSSSPCQVSYQLYLAFFEIVDILLIDELKKDLFVEIILNFDIWIAVEPDDHYQILQHWGKILLPNYHLLFTEFFTFSYLLDIIRIYYWYNPIEKDRIRGEPESSRPRNSKLNIPQCRSLMFNIMYDVSMLSFRNEDFSALIDHCITLKDENQQLDLLCFLSTISMAQHFPIQQISNVFQTLSRISFLLHNDDDRIITATINAIYSVYSYSRKDDLYLTFDQYLDALFKEIESRKMTESIFTDVFKIMQSFSPFMFPLCAYISYKLKILKLYLEINPSESFVSSPNWALWSICHAISSSHENKDIIYQFLCKCSSKEWQNLYNIITIISQAYGLSNKDCELQQKRYLKSLCSLVLFSGKNQYHQDDLIILSDLLRQQLFFRARKTNISDQILAFYNNSPFSKKKHTIEKEEICFMNHKNDQILYSELHQMDIIHLPLQKNRYFFGLNVSYEINSSNEFIFSWHDEDLAVDCLKISLKYRTLFRENLRFLILIASYLVKIKNDYVWKWLDEYKLTNEEINQFSEDLSFFYTKSIETKKYMDFTMNINDAMKKQCSFIDNLHINNFNENVAYGYIATHHSMKNFSTEAANKLFVIEHNIKSDIQSSSIISFNSSLAIERIRSKLEENHRLWRRLWSNVVVDGAPWDDTIINGKQNVIRWKRDNCFCKSFCPFKMKRNKNPKNHIDASIARDAGSSVTAKKKLKIHKIKLEEEYKKNAPPEILEISSEKFNIENIKEENSDQNDVKKLHSFDCERIEINNLVSGTFIIFNDSIHFIEKQSKKSYVLPGNSISYIFLRRRFHLKKAIEIFMLNGDSYFFNFPWNNAIEIVQKISLNLNVNKDCKIQKEENLQKYFSQQGFTEKWENSKMSNFEYLMLVNIYSGRSFNDSSQYPFFPWILTDYKSEKIDFNDPSIYRDLSKPIGAVGDSRFEELKHRMHDMRVFSNKPYLYSSFAICPLSIYLWMLRIEPFSTLHIEMQSGKFDHPSRLFSSIADTFKLVTTHLNDYRELIPEFYFLPEFLYNDNDYDLGYSHGKKVDDVVVPQWANNNGIEFVYMLRKALESDFVSAHLSQWIDLFWGFKQTGEEAKKAANLYSSDMYETAWNEKSLKDPHRHAEIEAAMCHVGQMPPHMFTEEHPKKKVILKPSSENPSAYQSDNSYDGNVISTDDDLFASSGSYSKARKNTSLNRTIIASLNYHDIEVAAFYYNKESKCFNLGLFNLCTKVLSLMVLNINILNNNSSPKINEKSITIESDIISMKTIKKGKKLLAVLKSGQLVKYDGEKLEYLHQDFSNVSCFSTSNKYICVVSDDATLNISGPNLNFSIPFYGDAINCCALSKEFKVAVCGTANGNIVICSMFEGKKVNAVKLHFSSEKCPRQSKSLESFEYSPYSDNDNNLESDDIKNEIPSQKNSIDYQLIDDDDKIIPIDILVTKAWGFIVTYAKSIKKGKVLYYLFLHTINGRFVRYIKLPSAISCWCTFSTYSDFDYISMAMDQGKIVCFEAFYLSLGKPIYRCYKHIAAIDYIKDMNKIVLVKSDGELIFCPFCVK